MSRGQPEIRALVTDAARRLAEAGVESARLDADVLMMHVLGVARAGLYLAYPNAAGLDVEARFLALVERRLAGEPVAYITGQREFMGLDFIVDRRVLVPRPETEWLVEWAVQRLQTRPTARLVVDVGTGSGAIAVSLAAQLPETNRPLIVASDRSATALTVAQLNVQRHVPERVRLVAGDLLSWARPGIDMILANLPYLHPAQAHPGIAWEPETALYAGGDGFDLYRRLLVEAAERLSADGALACEIDPGQRELAIAEAARHFPAANISVIPDLADLDRYLVVERRASQK